MLIIMQAVMDKVTIMMQLQHLYWRRKAGK